MGEKTIFTYLDNLYLKQGLTYDKKVAPAYLISLWISHANDLLPLANEINAFQFSLNDDIIYKYYYHKIPKGRRFIRWIKKDSTEETKKAKEAQDKIRVEMMLSKKEFANFKGLLSK